MLPVSFWEVQLMQTSLNFITSCCNSKIRSLTCLTFLLLQFRKRYDVLKWKSSWILLNKIMNFSQNGTEFKMENPTHSFRETKLVLQLIYESKMKSKNSDELELPKEKRGQFLYRWFCPKKIFLRFVFYLNV